MSKKYRCELTQQDNLWSAAIVRKVSAKKSVVSTKQDGFQSEADAKAWGESQLNAFLKQLSDKNKVQAERRKR